jgi:hypothetical protein
LKTWFQAFAFTFHLWRYTPDCPDAIKKLIDAGATLDEVGLCKLSSVDS